MEKNYNSIALPQKTMAEMVAYVSLNFKDYDLSFAEIPNFIKENNDWLMEPQDSATIFIYKIGKINNVYLVYPSKDGKLEKTTLGPTSQIRYEGLNVRLVTKASATPISC